MKKILKVLLLLLVVAVVTIGITYAFFTATIELPEFTVDAHQLEVIYIGDEEINGVLNLVKDKNGGYRREVSIGLSENSVGAAANIYISIGQITDTLATEALNWEIYRLENGVETLYDQGTFIDCGNIGESKRKCTAGNRIYMIDGLELSTTQQQFAIYIWLNGYKAGNEVIGATLKGYIGAETENISGILE